MTDYKWLFSARRGKDNTRNRKFPFQKVISFILAFRGGTLNLEIMDFFGWDPSQCHLVSKEGTSQRQHTAKPKQAVCCFLRHQGMTTKRIGKSALKRMFKSQELCYSIGEAGRRFLR